MEQETDEAAGAQLHYTEQAAGLIAERKRMIDALQELMHGSTMRLVERRAAEVRGASREDWLPPPALSNEQMETMAERIARVRARLAREAAENSTPAPGLPPEQMNELAVRIAKVREETRRKREEAEREGRPWPA